MRRNPMPVQRAYTAPPNLIACERWDEVRLPPPARRSPVMLKASERTDSGVDVEMDTEPRVVGNANFHVPSPLHEVDPQWKPTEPDCEIWEEMSSPATTEGSGWESHATESCTDPCDLPTHVHTQRVCRPLQQRRSSYHHPYSPPNSGRTMSPSPHRRRSSRPRDKRENIVFGTFVTPPSEASPNRLSAATPLIIVTSEPAPFLKARRPSSPFSASATSPYDLRPPCSLRAPIPIGASASVLSLDTTDTCSSSVSSREFLLTPPESPLLGIYEKQPECVSPPEPEPLDILAAGLREALDELDTI